MPQPDNWPYVPNKNAAVRPNRLSPPHAHGGPQPAHRHGQAARARPGAGGAAGLLGDEQADFSIHGGLGKAVYAYPAEHYPFWQQARREAGAAEIDDSLPHGSLAENLTLSGLLETEVWVGDVLRFLSCTLEVASPREPCHKLNAAMGFARAVRLMAESGFCGYYLRVREPGILSAGQSFELIPGPRSMGIPELFHAKRVKHLRGEF